LLLAASLGLRDICNELIQNGADTKAVDHGGHTAAFVLQATHLTKRIMTDVSGCVLHSRDLRSLFDSFDLNHTGFIEKAELIEMYKCEQKFYGVIASDRQVHDFVESCCGDTDRVSYETFCRVWVGVGKW